MKYSCTASPAVPPQPRAACRPGARPDTPSPAWPTPGCLKPAGRSAGCSQWTSQQFTDPRRDEYVQLYVREMLYRILERVRRRRPPWHACRHEDRGDGVVVVVPPVIPVDGLADPLPERLCGLIRVHNRLSSEDARIQLRAAAHVGKVYHDGHGFAGDAASHLFRLLQAPGFKQLLATSKRPGLHRLGLLLRHGHPPPSDAGRSDRLPAGHRGRQARDGHRLGAAPGGRVPLRPHPATGPSA